MEQKLLQAVVAWTSGLGKRGCSVFWVDVVKKSMQGQFSRKREGRNGCAHKPSAGQIRDLGQDLGILAQENERNCSNCTTRTNPTVNGRLLQMMQEERVGGAGEGGMTLGVPARAF